MAGVSKRRYERLNAARHDRRLRQAESGDGLRFRIECESRRANYARIPHGFAWLVIQAPRRFTLEECQAWFEIGYRVPLDLVPENYWFDEKAEAPRFGEEMLGADF